MTPILISIAIAAILAALIMFRIEKVEDGAKHYCPCCQQEQPHEEHTGFIKCMICDHIILNVNIVEKK